MSLTPVEPSQLSVLIPGIAALGRSLSMSEGDGGNRSNHLISERLGISRGKHNINLGAQFGADNNGLQFAAFQSGRAIIPGINAFTVPSPSADLFMIGSGGSTVSDRVVFLGFYGQDKYELGAALTLTGGLGYRVEFPPSSFRRHQSLEPSIGIRWSPKVKTVVQMGYEMVRARFPEDPVGFDLLLGGVGLREDAPAPVRIVTSFVGASAASTALSQFLATGHIPLGPQLATIYDRSSRGATIHNANISVQRSFSTHSFVKLSYLFDRRTSLIASTNVNLPPPVLINGRPDFQNGAVNADFAQIYEFRSTGSSSSHRGVLETQLYSGKGLQIDAQYSFSRTIDDVPAYSFEHTPQNDFDRRSDRSVAEFAPTHTLAISGNWQRTKSSAKYNIFRRLLSQPFLSGTFNYNSGLYFNVLAGSDANHDGNPLTDRPLNVGRNTFLGQTFARFDASAGFRCRVKESVGLELAVNALNVLNRTNFREFNTVLGKADLSGLNPRIVLGRNGLPDLNFEQPLTSTGFGLATRSFDPRRIEVSMKFDF